MGTIIMIGVIALTLGGAFWSYNHSQQAIGRAEAVAEYERQAKEAEQANALRALEGEQYALKLLDAAKKRNQVQAAQLVVARKQRETANAEREKVDPVYKAWASEPVPAFAVDQLRAATQLAAATTGSRGLPRDAGVSPAATVPAATGAPEQSWITKLRSRLSGANKNAVGSSGPAGK